MEFKKLMDSFCFHYSSDSEFNQDQSLDSSDEESDSEEYFMGFSDDPQHL